MLHVLTVLANISYMCSMCAICARQETRLLAVAWRRERGRGKREERGKGRKLFVVQLKPN